MEEGHGGPIFFGISLNSEQTGSESVLVENEEFRLIASSADGAVAGYGREVTLCLGQIGIWPWLRNTIASSGDRPVRRRAKGYLGVLAGSCDPICPTRVDLRRH